MFQKPIFGSFAYISMAAEKYDDIINVHRNEEEMELIITCKPDYDKELLNKFMDENIPISVYCKIEVY